ncbi:MAG: hypothetical protein HC769_10520 [Cyanobacteria bacterium CRU_2_1]|nr:hypothetical protein [Cyanobacteria bacterium RU_5_0]NJR59238.1 hypothetical protein [Cyanobacteria bacterium CRU_2_1]
MKESPCYPATPSLHHSITPSPIHPSTHPPIHPSTYHLITPDIQMKLDFATNPEDWSRSRCSSIFYVWLYAQP